MVNNRPYGQFSPTGVQLRAARAGLGLSVQALARESGLGVNTLRRAEDQPGAVTMTAVNLQRLADVLAAHGVTFVEANEDGPGVRFKV